MKNNINVFLKKLAKKFLRGKGYKIIAEDLHRWKDEVAFVFFDYENKELVFAVIGEKEKANAKQLTRIEKMAWHYLETCQKDWEKYFPHLPVYSFPEWRIDMLEIEAQISNGKAKIRQFKYLYA